MPSPNANPADLAHPADSILPSANPSPSSPTPASQKSSHPYNGFLNLNKAAGWTSHDCVAKVRRLLGMKKVGHAGTLDPAATGVLPIALGKATRLLQYLPSDKAYRAVVRFGVTTDTDDLEGTILTQQPAPNLTLAAIEARLSQFTGEIRQIPPRYSAIQVKGKRLYDLARQGKAVDVPERTVTVHSLQVVGWQTGDYPELSLEVACGAGTYIRSIARDLGEAVGTGATLAGLQRTRSSGFTLDQSLSLEALAQQLASAGVEPLPPDIGLQALPVVPLNGEERIYWCQGRKPRLVVKQSLAPETIVRVVGPGETFLGVGEIRLSDAVTVLSHRVVYAQP